MNDETGVGERERREAQRIAEQRREEELARADEADFDPDRAAARRVAIERREQRQDRARADDRSYGPCR